MVARERRGCVQFSLGREGGREKVLEDSPLQGRDSFNWDKQAKFVNKEEPMMKCGGEKRVY